MGIIPNLLGGKKDTVCGDSVVQTVMLGAAHRIFASGNERPAVRLNSKYNYGIPVEQGDSFTMLYDLVNQSRQPQMYYIQMVRTQSHYFCDADRYKRLTSGYPIPLHRTSRREWCGWTLLAVATATCQQKKAIMKLNLLRGAARSEV
jgi:hypothetical protein